MLDLWLIRHAESQGNLDGTESDSDLSSRGVEQAQGLARLLAHASFDAVFTSPLVRARRTATIALPARPALVDPRLSELRSEPSPHYLDPNDPDALSALLAMPVSVSESGKEFMNRVRAWRADLPQVGSIAAFTHVGVIREIIAALLGFARGPQGVHPAAVFRLSMASQEVAVLLWDSTEHLA